MQRGHAVAGGGKRKLSEGGQLCEKRRHDLCALGSSQVTELENEVGNDDIFRR